VERPSAAALRMLINGRHPPQLRPVVALRGRSQAAAAREHSADVVAVLVGRWEVMDREIDGRWTAIGDARYEAYLRRRLTLALRTVAAAGTRVVVLTAPYSRRVERPDGGLWPEDTTERVDRWNALVRQVAGEQQPAVPVIDLNRRTGPQGRYAERVDGIRLRYDGLHITARRTVARALAASTAHADRSLRPRRDGACGSPLAGQDAARAGVAAQAPGCWRGRAPRRMHR
jgi:hypothetical protein